jgi:ABC-type phosphate/phosphonate transport system substrate-binding protein
MDSREALLKGNDVGPVVFPGEPMRGTFIKSIRHESEYKMPEKAKKLYEPLAKELSRIVSDKVVFEAPESWAAYSRHMQEGKYDFVLDGPHFVAWRMSHLRHEPLVKLQSIGQGLGFVVLTSNSGPKALKDLRFQKVCSLASPNLAALVLLSQFDAFSSPSLVSPKGGIKGTFAAFEEGRCMATALPNWFADRIPKEKMAKFRKLYTSQELPNLALTAGPRVPSNRRGEIVKILTDPETQKGLQPLLKNQGGKNGGVFLPAKTAEYSGQERLLEGVIWGW